MRVSVVLLWFCLSHVQLQKGDDQLPVEDAVQSRRDRLLNVSHVETSELNNSNQLDVWAELRQLRDMVVEQRVLLQWSQSLTEELKKENAALNTRLLASEMEVQELKQVDSGKNKLINNKQQDKVSQISMLSNIQPSNSCTQMEVWDCGAVGKEDKALTTRLLASEMEVQELKWVDSDRPKVAFSFASGLNNHHGPLSVDSILVFSREITNVGKAFSPVTGVFTAPLRGVYYFRFNILGNGKSYRLAVCLFRNHEKILDVTDYPDGSNEYAIAGITLLLEKADQ
ncbi:hypothetical protein NFI96_023143, partial [Prochilodus magdalenae]